MIFFCDLSLIFKISNQKAIFLSTLLHLILKMHFFPYHFSNRYNLYNSTTCSDDNDDDKNDIVVKDREKVK